MLGFAFSHSTIIWAPKEGGDASLLITFLNIYFMGVIIPGAIHFNSGLLGWIVVLLFFSNLGFGVGCYGLCWCIGFESENIMHRCTAVSFLFTIANIIIKLSFRYKSIMIPVWLKYSYLEPFTPGMTIFGAVAFYCGLLIMSFDGMFRRSTNYHPHMIVSLVAGLYIGSMHGLTGLRNTAITYTLLYISSHFSIITCRQNAGWIMPNILLGSIGLYYIAIWLNEHPGFVTLMFQE